MVVGLAAGLAVGAAGGYVCGLLMGGGDEEAEAKGGSATTEAAALLMPGAGTINTGDVRVSLESSSSLLSALLHQLWPQLNKVGIKAVQESVEPMFAEKLPRAFSGMHFETLDLGSEPIKLENFVVHPVVDDTLRIELEINWDSNCDILLGGLPAGHTIGVKEMKLRSRLVVICRPIIDVSPIICSAQIAFITHPLIDLDFTGLADVADWGNVRPMVDKAIKDGLSGMVLPQRMFMKIDSACDFIKAYQRPLGVLRVKLVKGRGFPSKTGFMTDIPDMYCTFEFANKEWTSSVVQDRNDPEWNETVDFVLSDYGQILDIQALDKERIRSDVAMGSLQCSAVELLKDGGKKEFTLVPPTSEDKKTRGSVGKITLECELLPFSKDSDVVAPETDTPQPNAIRGMLIVFVSKLTGLPVAKEEASSFVKVTFGDKEFQTSTVAFDPEAAAEAEAAADKDDGESAKAIELSVLNPEFNAAFEIPIDSDPPEDGVTFEVMNGGTSLGKHNIPKEVFMAMKDELCSSTNNIGGAILHGGVQVMGLASKTDIPAETNSGSNE